jgi:Putative periplasmic protein kinase ArgK and related GTPases of G3E family
MAQLHVEQVGGVRKALAEAARTDESSAERVAKRFIELRPGMTDKLGARRHHLLTGRRGTGKSTLLHVVRKRLVDDGVAVAAVDMERFKGREFPDVLIEILIALLGEVRPRIRPKHLVADLRLRAQVAALRRELKQALNDPQSVKLRVERKASSGKSAVVSSAAGGSYKGVGAKGDASASKSTSSVTSAEAEYEELKIERLQELAPRIADVLTALVQRSSDQHAIVFVDDYYFVRLEDQPQVLAYLHQVCKGTGVWLKIGGVGTRLRPYSEGNPPVGMQPTQDIDRLALDVTLDDFATAQRFLEDMLDGVLSDFKVTSAALFSETARNRMVLACGGAVARDYITLTDAALDEAVERMSKAGSYTNGTAVNIQSADVHRAVRKRLNTKEEEELSIDAGSDAPAISARWRDICEFTRESGDIAFILVKQSDLDGTPWGKEIQQLESLRLLHRIKDTVPNTPNWRGIKTMAFMVDLAQVADQRLRTGIPEFWKGTAEFDKLRRAEWVYSPDWKNHQSKHISAQKDGKPITDPAAVEPEPLFDLDALTAEPDAAV